jgi:hypothetical protein
MEGTISRTARVSVARRNLKKAEGKIPARQTEIAYKAARTGQAGTCLIKPNIHPEGVEVDAAGEWEEGHANYPGRSVVPHWAMRQHSNIAGCIIDRPLADKIRFLL